MLSNNSPDLFLGRTKILILNFVGKVMMMMSTMLFPWLKPSLLVGSPLSTSLGSLQLRKNGGKKYFCTSIFFYQFWNVLQIHQSWNEHHRLTGRRSLFLIPRAFSCQRGQKVFPHFSVYFSELLCEVCSFCTFLHTEIKLHFQPGILFGWKFEGFF